MTSCFKCGKYPGEIKTNKKLARDKLPVFCSMECANLFPDNGTKEFNKIMKESSK